MINIKTARDTSHSKSELLVQKAIAFEDTPLINNNDNNTNICIIGCAVLFNYFIVFILPIFLDILFGFGNIIQCAYYEKPLIDIFIWMKVNGILSLFSFGCFFMRKQLGIPFYIINIVINIFLLLLTIIGTVSFFMYYNINDNSYIFIRMIMAPIIMIAKLVEIYYA